MNTKLIWNYFYQGGAAALALYKGEDNVIVSGEPGSDTVVLNYLAFPDVDVLADGSQVMAYRKALDHNADQAGAAIVFKKKTGSTWGVDVTVVDGGAPTFNITDPAIGVTQTGRILVFYCKSTTAGSPSQRTTYVKWSDDDGDTWSVETLFTDEQDTGGALFEKQLNGPGKAIQYDGYMLKPLYGTATPGAGGRQGILYKSVDDGETWTRVALIWDADNDDGEEPTILALASGRLLCAQRSDTVDETRILYSDDAGLTWSSPVSIGLEAVAKSPMAVSPDGTIVILTRWSGPGGHPIYTYTNDPTGIAGWSAYAFVSVRDTSYMYGGINWVTDRFHFIWAQGVLDEPIPSTSGPTLIIEKEFIPSLLAVAEPTENGVEYQAWLDYPQGRGATVPAVSDLKALHNTLVDDLKAAGYWTELDGLWVFIHNDTGLQAYSLYKGQSPFLNIATIPVAPTYAVDGWSFNGSSQYINLQWAPSQGINFLQNDASFFMWVETNEQGNNAAGCSNANATTISNAVAINPRSASDVAALRMNDSTADTVASTDSRGLWMGQRRAVDDKRLWKNGVQVGNWTTASLTRTAIKIGVGCINFANGPGTYRATKVSIIGVGSALSGGELGLYNILSAYRTNVLAL